VKGIGTQGGPFVSVSSALIGPPSGAGPSEGQGTPAHLIQLSTRVEQIRPPQAPEPCTCSLTISFDASYVRTGPSASSSVGAYPSSRQRARGLRPSRMFPNPSPCSFHHTRDHGPGMSLWDPVARRPMAGATVFVRHAKGGTPSPVSAATRKLFAHDYVLQVIGAVVASLVS
jgi:hypothetical protein